MANTTTKKWHLLSYDIRNPRRLRRIHYYLSKNAVTLQRSVFIYRGNEQEFRALKQRILKLADPHEDDIRAYPLSHPDQVWSTGYRSVALNGLHGASKPVQAKKPGFVRRLLNSAASWRSTT